LTVCAVLVFYDTFYQAGTLQRFVSKLASILAPVLYGFAIAYLLTPIMSCLERAIAALWKTLFKKELKQPSGALRLVSILLTEAVVIFLLYLLLSVLVPQVVDSVTTLINNAQGYYRKVYRWANDLLERWQAAEDRVQEYELICEELQQTSDGIVTLTAVEGDTLSDAMSALEIGGMTAVIDPYGEGTSFVVLRTEPDLSAVAETYFDVLWNQKMEEATVVTNSKLYDGVDVGTFYEKLLQLRQDMMAEMDGGAQTDDDQTGGSQSDSADDSADSAADDPQPAA